MRIYICLHTKFAVLEKVQFTSSKMFQIKEEKSSLSKRPTVFLMTIKCSSHGVWSRNQNRELTLGSSRT